MRLAQRTLVSRCPAPDLTRGDSLGACPRMSPGGVGCCPADDARDYVDLPAARFLGLVDALVGQVGDLVPARSRSSSSADRWTRPRIASHLPASKKSIASASSGWCLLGLSQRNASSTRAWIANASTRERLDARRLLRPRQVILASVLVPLHGVLARSRRASGARNRTASLIPRNSSRVRRISS